MRNQQVLIDSLPQGKLSASNYRLAESEIAPPARWPSAGQNNGVCHYCGHSGGPAG